MSDLLPSDSSSQQPYSMFEVNFASNRYEGKGSVASKAITGLVVVLITGLIATAERYFFGIHVFSLPTRSIKKEALAKINKGKEERTKSNNLYLPSSTSLEEKNWEDATSKTEELNNHTRGFQGQKEKGISRQKAREIWHNTPEGLSLITDAGEFRPPEDLAPGKPSVIFVHGWQNQTYLLPEFLNRAAWQKHFNTFVLRWHKRALDNSSSCAVPGSILGGTRLQKLSVQLYPDGCPKKAEYNIWSGADSSGEFLVKEYKQFFSQLYNYQQEIWVLAVSLGTQAGTYLTYKLWQENWPGPKPIRLELIDPYIGLQIFAGTGQMPKDTVYPLPPDSGLPDSDGFGLKGCTAETASTKILCVMENSLYQLKVHHQVATAAHLTATGRRLSAPLGGRFHQFMPVQNFSLNWLCPLKESHLGKFEQGHRGEAKCLWGIRDNPLEIGTGTHNGAIWAWFWSINELPSDLNTINARTPTNLLRNIQGRVRNQSPTGNWCRLPQEWNWRKVFRMAFLGEREDGYLLPRLQTKQSLLERLKHMVGLPELDAIQCVEAVSIHNDVFESPEKN